MSNEEIVRLKLWKVGGWKVIIGERMKRNNDRNRGRFEDKKKI